jgi:hypothetical protein
MLIYKVLGMERYSELLNPTSAEIIKKHHPLAPQKYV